MSNYYSFVLVRFLIFATMKRNVDIAIRFPVVEIIIYDIQCKYSTVLLSPCYK